MNIPLLRQIAELIQEKPDLFDMYFFTAYTSCGTSHCIGGWAEELTGVNAEAALQITKEQADRLFYVSPVSDGLGTPVAGWPKDFHGKPNVWEPTVEQAVARIEHFIATEGRE